MLNIYLMTDGDENERVKNYSNDDDKHLIFLGSVLHNEKSRAMYHLLSNNPYREYYLKEMAVIIEKDDNPRLPIYEHHIKVMVKSGLVIVTEKMHNKHKTKFYKVPPFILLSPSKYYDKTRTNKTLSNAFDQIFKFVIVGVLPTINFFITRIHIQQILKPLNYSFR